ncbi:hypothetical protein FOZ62_016429, partial [Perkinsus olseni]
IPCTPGYERAHLFISCQLMQQTENGTQLTMVSHVDPNGVPRWVLNKIAHRKPREFCAALKEQLYKRNNLKRVRKPPATSASKICKAVGCERQVRTGASYCISHGGGNTCE